MAKYTKRRDKRGYEWKSAYREKEALMLERGYPEVSPHDFYRELFPAGCLQQESEDGKGNIIATQIRPSGKGRTRQWVIDDSLKMLDKVIGDRFGLIPPISFYGKSHTKENAHELFAVVVDGTRALTCKYNAQLSCGRVQTPTLAMIAKREEEIRAFKPKEYYGITLKAGDITWTWKEPKSKSFRTFNKERAEEISDVLRNWGGHWVAL